MAAMLLLTACTAADIAPSPAAAVTAPPAAVPDVPGTAAESFRHRSDVAIGDSSQVRLTNTGTAPFTVTSVQLDSPGFAVLPARELTQEFAPDAGTTSPPGSGPSSARRHPTRSPPG